MKNRQTIQPSELASLITTRRIDGQPFVVSIAGGSASGKTTIAQQCVEGLGTDTAEVSSQDWFQLGKNFPARKTSRYKWDDPENFDLPACQDALRQLRLGQPVHFLAFDVMENIRTDERVVDPMQVIIWEGVYAAFTPELRELSDIIIYVDTPYELRLIRRISRFFTRNNIDDVSVPARQMLTFVLEAELAFGRKQKEFADFVIENDPLEIDGEIRALIECTASFRQLFTDLSLGRIVEKYQYKALVFCLYEKGFSIEQAGSRVYATNLEVEIVARVKENINTVLS